MSSPPSLTPRRPRASSTTSTTPAPTQRPRSKSRTRPAPVPILIQSFPSPPSHIPTTSPSPPASASLKIGGSGLSPGLSITGDTSPNSSAAPSISASGTPDVRSPTLSYYFDVSAPSTPPVQSDTPNAARPRPRPRPPTSDTPSPDDGSATTPQYATNLLAAVASYDSHSHHSSSHSHATTKKRSSTASTSSTRSRNYHQTYNYTPPPSPNPSIDPGPPPKHGLPPLPVSGVGVIRTTGVGKRSSSSSSSSGGGGTVPRRRSRLSAAASFPAVAEAVQEDGRGDGDREETPEPEKMVKQEEEAEDEGDGLMTPKRNSTVEDTTPTRSLRRRSNNTSASKKRDSYRDSLREEYLSSSTSSVSPLRRSVVLEKLEAEMLQLEAEMQGVDGAFSGTGEEEEDLDLEAILELGVGVNSQAFPARVGYIIGGRDRDKDKRRKSGGSGRLKDSHRRREGIADFSASNYVHPSTPNPTSTSTPTTPASPSFLLHSTSPPPPPLLPLAIYQPLPSSSTTLALPLNIPASPSSSVSSDASWCSNFDQGDGSARTSRQPSVIANPGPVQEMDMAEEKDQDQEIEAQKFKPHAEAQVSPTNFRSDQGRTDNLAQMSAPSLAATAPKVIPRTQTTPPRTRPRTPSPDITAIISATQRPRRKSSAGAPLVVPRRSKSSASVRTQWTESAESASAPRRKVVRKSKSTVMGRGRSEKTRKEKEEEEELGRRKKEAEKEKAKRKRLLGLESQRYGYVSTLDDVLPSTRNSAVTVTTEGSEDGVEVDEQEEDEEEEGYESADSSLDLHTPLPNLMVRHGHLSTKSKLLPPPDDATADGKTTRPESGFSMTSTMTTKSGLMRDERNTPMRRVRHRDGKQLRGGLGLTTGLGWSDSEDEDAPSALTRSISRSISSIKLTKAYKDSGPGHSVIRRTSSSSALMGTTTTTSSSSSSKPRSSQSSTSSSKSQATTTAATTAPSSKFDVRELSIPEHASLSLSKAASSSSPMATKLPLTTRSSSSLAISLDEHAVIDIGPRRAGFGYTPQVVDRNKVLPPLPVSAPPNSTAVRFVAGTTSLKKPPLGGTLMRPRARTLSSIANATNGTSQTSKVPSMPNSTVGSVTYSYATPHPRQFAQITGAPVHVKPNVRSTTLPTPTPTKRPITPKSSYSNLTLGIPNGYKPTKAPLPKPLTLSPLPMSRTSPSLLSAPSPMGGKAVSGLPVGGNHAMSAARRLRMPSPSGRS